MTRSVEEQALVYRWAREAGIDDPDLREMLQGIAFADCPADLGPEDYAEVLVAIGRYGRWNDGAAQ